MKYARLAIKALLTLLFMFSGSMHFIEPAPFVRIMPSYLPWHLELVLISGFFEIVGAVGMWIPRIKNIAGWGLIALLIAVFPANLNMALNEITFDGKIPTAMLWMRLPLQLLMIWAVWWVACENEAGKMPTLAGDSHERID